MTDSSGGCGHVNVRADSLASDRASALFDSDVLLHKPSLTLDLGKSRKNPSLPLRGVLLGLRMLTGHQVAEMLRLLLRTRHVLEGKGNGKTFCKLCRSGAPSHKLLASALSAVCRRYRPRARPKL